MNVAVTAGTNAAIIAALARKKLITHFEAAGATSPETAIPLPTKRSAMMVKSLEKQGVLKPAGQGLYYLDADANARVLQAQGKVGVAVVLTLLGVLVLVVAGLFLAGSL